MNFNAGFLFGGIAEGEGFESLREVGPPESLFWPGRYKERERENSEELRKQPKVACGKLA